MHKMHAYMLNKEKRQGSKVCLKHLKENNDHIMLADKINVVERKLMTECFGSIL